MGQVWPYHIIKYDLIREMKLEMSASAEDDHDGDDCCHYSLSWSFHFPQRRLPSPPNTDSPPIINFYHCRVVTPISRAKDQSAFSYTSCVVYYYNIQVHEVFARHTLEMLHSGGWQTKSYRNIWKCIIILSRCTSSR